MTVPATASFVEALLADRPAADRAERMGLYAFLIGLWEMDGVIHRDDGSRYEARGSIHAAWVLEGRALQDVWIFPETFYGTTLRVYDPSLDAWHIFWSDPLRQLHLRQLGRANGKDVVQNGTLESGVRTRWSFRELSDDSFRWRGERSLDGDTWQLQAEFFAKRVAS